MTTLGPLAQCPICGSTAPIVNYTPHEFGPGNHGGYLGRHHRPGTRPGTNCRGSFGRWLVLADEDQPLALLKALSDILDT